MKKRLLCFSLLFLFGIIFQLEAAKLTLGSDGIITNNLTVANGSTFELGTLSIEVDGASDINGTLTISTGTYDADGAFDATGGNVTFTDAGTLELGGAVTSLGTFTRATSTVSYNGTVDQTVSGANYYNLNTAGSGTKTAAEDVYVYNNFTVNSGTYDLGSYNTTVTGTTDVNGSLEIDNTVFDAEGIFDATGGNVIFSGSGYLYLKNTVTSLGTLTAGSGKVFYQKNGTQNIMPGSYYQLEINGTGIKTLTGDVTVANQLAIWTTSLSLSDYNLTLQGNTPIVGVFDANKMIITDGSGILKKEFAGTGSFTFPIGSALDNYSPVTLEFTGGTFIPDCWVGIKTANNKHPQNESSNDYLNRYWTVTSDGISDFSCNASFTYLDGDITGTESNIYSASHNGSDWTAYSAVDAANNKLEATVSSFSDFTGYQGYTITYNTNTATSGSAPANQIKLHDVSLTTQTNSGNLVKTGHTFKGWNTAANGTGTHYDAGSSFAANAGTTLYAEWEPLVYRSVADGNWSDPNTWEQSDDGGSTWGAAAQVPSSTSGSITINSNVTVNADITIDQTTVNSGKTLTVANGTTLTITNGAAADLTSNGDIDVNGTLEFINTCTADINGSFDATGGNVTFDGGGGLFLSGVVTTLGTFTPGTSTVYYDGADQTIAVASYNNLSFAGSTSGSTKTFADGTTSVATEIVLTDDITLTGSSADVTVQVTTPGSGGTNSRVFNINAAGKTIDISNMTIKGGDISGSNGEGGAIYITGSSTNNFSDLVITGSKARYGGAIYAINGTALTLDNTIISSSEASTSGGGIYCDQNSDLIIKNSLVNNNSATLYGGGITVPTFGCSVQIENCTISENSAQTAGGVIFASSSTIVNSTIAGNSAANGGGIYVYSGSTAILNSIIAYNRKSSNNGYSDLVVFDGSYVARYSVLGGVSNNEGYHNVNYTYENGHGDPLFDSYTEIVADQVYQPVLADNGGPTQTYSIPVNSVAYQTGGQCGTFNNGENYAFYVEGSWYDASAGNTVGEAVIAITTDQRGENRQTNTNMGSYDELLQYAPTVTTQAVDGIYATTATGNGNITDIGLPDPTQYGHCWSTEETPAIDDGNDFKTEKGATSSTGAFTSDLTGLTASTTYYVRAYATNVAGTAYGDQVSFTTTAAEPANQATDIIFSGTYANKTSISWTRGNGEKAIVFMKAGTTDSPVLTDRTTYTADNTFGSGSSIAQAKAVKQKLMTKRIKTLRDKGGNDWYCVYNGTGSSVNVTNLTPNTAYRVQVFEYNGTVGLENYLLDTANDNPKNITTNNPTDDFFTYDGSSYADDSTVNENKTEDVDLDIPVSVTSQYDTNNFNWSVSNETNCTVVEKAKSTSTDNKIYTVSTAENYYGSASFKLTVNDGNADHVINFNLTVNNVNDAPEITSTPGTAVLEDQVYTYNITTTDIDNENLTITAPTKPDWLSLNLDVKGSASATLTGTPLNEHVGDHEVVIQVSDNVTKLVDTQEFTITVTNVNDRPVLSGLDYTMTLDEDPVTNNGVQVSSIIGEGITDVDAGAVEGLYIAYKAETNGTWEYSTNQTSWNDLFIAKVGGVYVPADYYLRFVPDANWYGEKTLDINAWDQTAHVAIGSKKGIVLSTITKDVKDDYTDTSLEQDVITLTVNNVNDAPEITSTAVTEATEDQVYTYNITTTDIDNENLTITAPAKPDWLSLNLDVKGSASATLTGTPSNEHVGDHEVVIQVSDNVTKLVDTQEFTITVTNVNDRPVLSDLDYTMTLDEDPVSNNGVQVSSIIGEGITDVDAGAVEGLYIAYKAETNGTWEYSTNQTSWNDLFVAKVGGVYVPADYYLRFVPDANWYGEKTLDINAWDQTAHTAIGSKKGIVLSTIIKDVKVDYTDTSLEQDVITLTVNNINDAPEITDQVVLSTPEETALTIAFDHLTVSDPDNNYPADFTLTVNSGNNYTVNGTTITPVLDFNGDLTVPVTVNDNVAKAVSNTFNLTISVTAVNDQPTIDINTGLTLNEGDLVTIINSNLSSSDVDNDNTGLIYTVTVLPGNGLLKKGETELELNNTFTQSDLNNNLITYTHNNGETTQDSFKFTVKDDSVFVTAEATFNFDIELLNENPPVITANQNFEVAENAANNTTIGTLLATDEDLNTVFEWSINGGNNDGIFAINSQGKLIIADNTNLDYETTTSYTLDITVSDGTNTSAEVDIEIDVIDKDDPIIITRLAHSDYEDERWHTNDQYIKEMESVDFYVKAYDPDGNNLTYSWRFDKIEVSTDSVCTFTTDYLSAGRHTVTLVIEDNYESSISKDAKSYINFYWNIFIENVNRPFEVTELTYASLQNGSWVTENQEITELDSLNFSVTALDPDGNNLSYLWRVNGMGVSTREDYNFQTDFDSEGNYEIDLTVTDESKSDKGKETDSQSFSWNVKVNNYDQPIEVTELTYASLQNGIWIPENQEISETDNLNFKVTARDLDGNNLSYNWKLNGSSVSTRSDYNFITDYDSEGDYELTITITDETKARSTLDYTWNIKVNNLDQPIEVTELSYASLTNGVWTTTDQEITETDNLDFFVTALDPDGDALTYNWQLDGVTVSTSVDYNFTTDYNSEGNYEVVLVISNNSRIAKSYNDQQTKSKETKTYSWNIKVNNLDQPIEVTELSYASLTNGVWTTTDQEISETDSLRFSVSAFDPDGNELAYSWRVNGELVSTEAVNEFRTTYDMAGEYVVTLTIADSKNTVNFSWEVIILNTNRAPVIESYTPEADSIEVTAGTELSFSIDALDPDEDTLVYSWIVNDEDQGNNETNFNYSFAGGEFIVSCIVSDGALADSVSWKVVSTVGIVELIPETTKLHAAYPNPFNPSTNIKFGLKEDGVINLGVYNVRGQLVKQLINGNLNAGMHVVKFSSGNLTSGSYFILMKADNKIFKQKILLVK